jgi:uncharacterized membrane protein YbhN (UPF0104 family)
VVAVAILSLEPQAVLVQPGELTVAEVVAVAGLTMASLPARVAMALLD